MAFKKPYPVYAVLGVIVFLLIIMLSACSGVPKVDKLVSVGVACDSYASTLQVVAGMNERGRLRPSDVKVVDSVVAVVGPVCRHPEKAVTGQVLAQVQKGVEALLDMKVKAMLGEK